MVFTCWVIYTLHNIARMEIILESYWDHLSLVTVFKIYSIIVFERKYYSISHFQLHVDQVLEKDDQQLPIKEKNCIVADVHQQSDEESEAEDDMIPVEIKPGHIRFQSRGKG